MFEHSDAAVSMGNGKLQVMNLPPQVLLMYVGWRNVHEARAIAPYMHVRRTAAASEPAGFVAGQWLGVVIFAAGALWLAFH